MSQTKVLYRLQKLDLEMDKRRSRVREITAVLEGNKALIDARATAESLQTELHPLQTHATDLNLEIQSVTDQSRQLSERLYSGEVQNPKELQEIEVKIAELKRRDADLQNSMLETMMRVEELQATLGEATTRVSEIEAEWSSSQSQLLEEQTRLKREYKKLKAQREELVQPIDPADLELYQSLRATKQGHAVAALNGEDCSYCRVEQTSNLVVKIRRGDEIVFCLSCGRILVSP
jgi:predicted  nucleic acid-binding Zn-ribbon protein